LKGNISVEPIFQTVDKYDCTCWQFFSLFKRHSLSTFRAAINSLLYCADRGHIVRIRDHTNDHTKWKAQKELGRRWSK